MLGLPNIVDQTELDAACSYPSWRWRTCTQQVRGVLSRSTGLWPVRLQGTLVPKRQTLAHVVHLVTLLRCMT